jgi:hypothetical protein
MWGTLRRIVGVRVNVDREKAISLARSTCEERGWPWIEPVYVRVSLRRYEIMTNAEHRGGNVFLTVDCETGAVDSAGPTPR